MDYANYKYYYRLSKFGIDLNLPPSRNENGDLSIPLAIMLNIKTLSAMDDQTYFYEYQKNWRACDKTTSEDKEKANLNKCLRKIFFQDALGFSPFGQMGKIVNHPKVFANSHKLNSFEYREKKCDACDQGNYYWDYRNKKMALNIATQVKASNHKRSVIVVGSGHVYGLIEAFQRDHPDLKILTYHDYLKSK